MLGANQDRERAEAAEAKLEQVQVRGGPVHVGFAVLVAS